MELQNALKSIGFTQQEALLYIYLCQHGELTGYEVAKLSGISRSNAYAALSNLVDKGYAYVVEGTSSKYTAVPKSELIKNAERAFETNINIIKKNLEFNLPHQESYVTIVGDNAILNKLKNILSSAQKRIYIACSEPLLSFLEQEGMPKASDQLKVVLLAPRDWSAKDSHIYYKTEQTDSFKLITDTSEVLAGTLKQALYSKNTTLVSLIRESFVHEIAVIESKNK